MACLALRVQNSPQEPTVQVPGFKIVAAGQYVYDTWVLGFSGLYLLQRLGFLHFVVRASNDSPCRHGARKKAGDWDGRRLGQVLLLMIYILHHKLWELCYTPYYYG